MYPPQNDAVQIEHTNSNQPSLPNRDKRPDRNKIIEMLKKLAKERNKCVIVVTHSKEVAAAADTILELSNKKLKEVRKDN